MALRNIARYLLVVATLVSGAGLAVTVPQQRDRSLYNAAISDSNYVGAARFGGEHGEFAAAFGRHQDGDIDNARVMYGEIGRADDASLRAAAFFNLGNSYIRQAQQLDLDADADRALPLIELAKMNYRKSLAIDNSNWDARKNLQRALLLLPDANPRVPMEVQGRRGAVRTVTSADSEKNYP